MRILDEEHIIACVHSEDFDVSYIPSIEGDLSLTEIIRDLGEQAPSNAQPVSPPIVSAFRNISYRTVATQTPICDVSLWDADIPLAVIDMFDEASALNAQSLQPRATQTEMPLDKVLNASPLLNQLEIKESLQRNPFIKVDWDLVNRLLPAPINYRYLSVILLINAVVMLGLVISSYAIIFHFAPSIWRPYDRLVIHSPNYGDFLFHNTTISASITNDITLLSNAGFVFATTANTTTRIDSDGTCRCV